MYEYIINKSRFIAISYDVSTKDDVMKIQADLRKEYKDATHVCYAYLINNGTSAGMSDDGEPSGTAGKPLLNLLMIKKHNNKAVFVIRYFGKSKLGAGLLLRSYINAAKEVL
jgi:putative IMPACT (imprinted ancient) family translation regulator